MLTADEVVDAYYLEVRCMLLEIAATLDRLDRAASQADPQPGRQAQVERLYQALGLLAERQASPDRSERLLNLFSE